MKINNRIIHRNFAFFYFGLIISFSFSGILNNHRNSFNIPVNYTYETQNFNIKLPIIKSKFKNKKYVSNQAKIWYPDSEFEGYRIKGTDLRAYYKDNTIIDLYLENGLGEIEYRRKTPILGHSIFLHKSTNNWWIWYSDIFALSLMAIAITGILMNNGKNGFKKYGWKLTIAGLVFPFIFLILFA